MKAHMFTISISLIHSLKCYLLVFFKAISLSLALYLSLSFPSLTLKEQKQKHFRNKWSVKSTGISYPDLGAEFMNSEKVKKSIKINYIPTHPNSYCGSPGPIVFITTSQVSTGSTAFGHPKAFREGMALCQVSQSWQYFSFSY